MVGEENRKGCLMAYVSPKSSQIILNWNKKFIPDEYLYIKDNDYGRDKEPHVTILYGFVPDLNESQIKEILKGTKNFSVTITGLGVFENAEYDVIKLNVDSSELRRLNSICKKYPHQSDYPNYSPHLTLAYVKKGYGKKFKNIKSTIPTTIIMNTIVYSGIKHQKIRFKLS
jgi:2'-5' RNA ligase